MAQPTGLGQEELELWNSSLPCLGIWGFAVLWCGVEKVTPGANLNTKPTQFLARHTQLIYPPQYKFSETGDAKFVEGLKNTASVKCQVASGKWQAWQVASPTLWCPLRPAWCLARPGWRGRPSRGPRGGRSGHWRPPRSARGPDTRPGWGCPAWRRRGPWAGSWDVLGSGLAWSLSREKTG